MNESPRLKERKERWREWEERGNRTGKKEISGKKTNKKVEKELRKKAAHRRESKVAKLLPSEEIHEQADLKTT